MITDMRVVNLIDRTLLDVPAPLAAALHSRLEALLFSEDAQIVDSSLEMVIIDVHGPAAPMLTEGRQMIRDDAFDLPGFSAFVAARQAGPLVDELVIRGGVKTTLETLDVVRIEAGRPVFLVDMDEHTIPLEAGLEQRAISFTKGCYVGQEVIVRVTQRGGGRVAKRLVGLKLSKAELPKSGDPISADGREIGRLTSVTWSPALASGIALGYVHRDYVAPATSVTVVHGATTISASVSPLPFVVRKTTISR
jgi:folate-binding protein YgfZ